jgi:hypothetical protein
MPPMERLASTKSAHEELERALSSEDSLHAWLRSHGYGPDPQPLPLPLTKVLEGAQSWQGLAVQAPRLLLLWRPDMSERSAPGNTLRLFQQEANLYIHRLRSEGESRRLPNLALVASREFLLAFPLDGNPFARRLRFTPARLRSGDTAPPTWDFNKLFAGSQLDDDFVALMGHARRRIATLLLDSPLGSKLLKDLWPRRYRHALIATVDTVLLRLVLSRYVEAQYGHSLSPEEQRQVASGSRDGSITQPADLLQSFLLEHHRPEFTLLLEGSYADLDPRAFQRFYEQTIGTDIRLIYNKDSGTVQVGVVDFERNRKEQGAYFTDERLCAWLAERTLGRTWNEWKQRLVSTLERHAREPAGRLPELRALLDELLYWRLLDPTCGGGIFLRAAFERLAEMREQVVDLLRHHLPAEIFRELTAREPYSLFRAEAPVGEWEWHILLNMLYGVDVDAKAVNVASNLLTLSALTYKPNGLCFPSFINVNLKRGNALVPLLKPSGREAFSAKLRGELKELIALRKRLRNPNLQREDWKALHSQATEQTQHLVQAQLTETFAGIFPGLSDKERLRRIQQVGAFFYEVEFPEVFFDNEGRLLPKPGFDIILGNPPWEEPAAEPKQFLPEFDPDFRALRGREAERREKELLKDPEIQSQWETYEQSVEDFKTLLSSGWYEHQSRRVRGKLAGAETNLYKYATELSWHLLKEGGRAGLVLDGGIWGDLVASGLRALLLDESRVEAVCGFVNRKPIFVDVEPRMRFSANVFQRGERTETLRAVFMREDLDDLKQFDSLAVAIPAEEVRKDVRGSYPVPEVRSTQHYVAERSLTRHPSLDAEPWDVDTYSREMHAGEQKDYFLDSMAPGCYPLIQGEQFNLFGVHQGAPPEKWLDPSDRGVGGFLREKQRGRILDTIAYYLSASGKLKGAKRQAALDWVRSVTGRKSVPDEWLRLDWDGYRIAWRDIARNDDQRTLIVAILPPRVGVTDTAPFVRPFKVKVTAKGVEWVNQYPFDQLLYLAGALSSFCCDSIARGRVAKNHLKSYLFQSLHVPAWKGTREQQRVAELTARLTCLPATAERPWADYRELAKAVGLVPERHALVDPAERREAEVELNALMAQLYGLGREDFRFFMDLLFMTPRYREAHALMRDDVTARLPGMCAPPATGR